MNPTKAFQVPMRSNMKGDSSLTLEEKLEKLELKIETYQPKTPWELANHRTLKHLHSMRQALLKAIDRRDSEHRTRN